MIGTFADFLKRKLSEASWYSDGQAANEPSYTELEGDVDQPPRPSRLRGGSIRRPARLGNDVIDQLPGAQSYSAIRPDMPEEELDPMGVFGQDDQDEPMGVTSDEKPRDLGEPLGATDCDYCGEIRSVYDDGAGGKGCARCLQNGPPEFDDDEFAHQAPPEDEPAAPEPDEVLGFSPDRERKVAARDSDSPYYDTPIRRTKSWKLHRDNQYRPLG